MSPPTISYPGSKGRLAPFLVSLMPVQGGLYLEPFAGRGNVFFAAAASSLQFERWWLNDINTAGFFETLKDRGARIKVPLRTRSEFVQQKRLFLKRRSPRAVLLEPYLTFSGGGYRKGGFGNQNGPDPKRYQLTLRRCAGMLRDRSVKVTSLDWADIDFQALTAEDLVYFDPPYYGADVRAYDSQIDCAALLRVLTQASFKWILTEYRQDFYTPVLGKPCWMKSMQLACDGRGNRRRVECVWKNF
jgi:site-specific DNA-adenine methylase